ncbi:MAG TPA: DUF1592 domain-containing protein [Lacipirellulaceae bacterium]|nr:DUF1592 domain-containing protein [Lacipirellulaceae bacterium]
MSLPLPLGFWSRRISCAAGSLLVLVAALRCPAAERSLDRALLEAHCFDCHGNGAREGNLALDELLAEDPATPSARDKWRKVWKMTRQEFMPPPDVTAMDLADRKQLVRWVEQSQLGIDYDRPDPGRVTMRRLNRIEYEHSVSDLFGVDMRESNHAAGSMGTWETPLRELLPPDDTAYGFDNIGDFQTLSPALLEKYFEIAELVVRGVIITDGPWYPTQQVEAREDHDVEEDAEAPRAALAGAFDLEHAAQYRVDVRFTLGGWQEYAGGYDFRFTVDGVEAASTTIDVGGQETHNFSFAARFEPGEHVVRLETKAVKPDYRGRMRPLRLNPRIELTGPIAADVRSYPESHQRIFFRGEPPQDPKERRAYAREILERVASRAFRRPVDARTLDGLAALAMTESNFERGIGNGLVAILTSPRFLFRTETQPQPDDPSVQHALDEYALASRLSYLLWLSLPDGELLELAAAGRLRQELPAQVQRMLGDPKSSRFFEDFGGQWLRTRNVLMTAISRREAIDPYRGEMKRETDMLFEHVARNDRDLIELVTADYTFLNEHLAKFYGIDGVRGGEFRRVDLPEGSHRGGVLGHGSFLVSTSNPDRTSPVKRGLFVLENLLATQPPPPPAGVPALEDAQGGGHELRTVRAQLEAHRADPACAACHAHFDPIGVVLENYDLIGRWREAERGVPVDPTATTVTGEPLAGVDDLRNYVAGNKERFYRCCTEKLLTYALGRGLEPFDAVTIDRITAHVMREQGKFSALLLAVVESPAFQMRRGNDDALVTAPRVVTPEIPPVEKRRPRRRSGFRQFNPDNPRPRAEREPEAEPLPAALPEEREADNG